MSMSEPVRFKNGDLVRVRVGTPDYHFRTPDYIQGKSGRITALCGVFPNPETLAHGGDGNPAKPLYRVEFAQGDVWTNYGGPAGDRLLVDIYEHWLELAE